MIILVAGVYVWSKEKKKEEEKGKVESSELSSYREMDDGSSFESGSASSHRTR